MATPVKYPSAEQTAIQVGSNLTAAENNLFKAYNLKEGASQAELKKLAAQMNVTASNLSVRSLQLVAEQRFQAASQALNMFSAILDRIGQLKQQIINRFAS